MAVAKLRQPYEKTYGYDAAGRTTSVVTSAGTTTLAYDYEGRISTITYPSSATNSFTYNGLDTRVGKVDSAGTTTYRRDGDDVLSPVLEAGGTKFTPGISRRTGTSSYFYHQDRMGSAVRQTNSTQGSLTSRQYDAFGNIAYVGGTWVGPFGFVGGEGYQEDSDSGLQLLGHRYYDSSTGRFLTRDPIKDGRNWYGYVKNNPLKWADPFGWICVQIGLGYGGVLPGISGSVSGGIVLGDEGFGVYEQHGIGWGFGLGGGPTAGFGYDNGSLPPRGKPVDSTALGFNVLTITGELTQDENGNQTGWGGSWGPGDAAGGYRENRRTRAYTVKWADLANLVDESTREIRQTLNGIEPQITEAIRRIYQ